MLFKKIHIYLFSHATCGVHVLVAFVVVGLRIGSLSSCMIIDY